MQPKLELLSQELVGRILDETFQLLHSTGVKVQSPEAQKLLAQAGYPKGFKFELDWATTMDADLVQLLKAYWMAIQ